jgi:hypothetical protein
MAKGGHRDRGELDRAAAYAAATPEARFCSVADMATTLWSYAHLRAPPGRLLDHCLLSAMDLMRDGQGRLYARVRCISQVYCVVLIASGPVLAFGQWLAIF